MTPDRVEELLGPGRFQAEKVRRGAGPGVATGLAWTPVGGDVLTVEAIAMPGRGRLKVTGQLGEVMQESAQAAVSWVKTNIRRIDPEVPTDWFETHDIHLHVPAGAIPKDGPSAGITIATAITSLVTERKVRDDTAMTGEITLTGLVLPIGGLKDKALAAQRAGITRVLAPKLNEPDLKDMPDQLTAKVKFIFVEHIEDVLDEALAKRRSRSAPSGGRAARRA